MTFRLLNTKQIQLETNFPILSLVSVPLPLGSSVCLRTACVYHDTLQQQRLGQPRVSRSATTAGTVCALEAPSEVVANVARYPVTRAECFLI